MLPARLQLVRSLGATELANKVEKLIKNPIKLSDYEALGVFGPMETIIHGDFWSNNMMFKLGDNDKVLDISKNFSHLSSLELKNNIFRFLWHLVLTK